MTQSSASSDDNGNGKVSLALLKQSIEHMCAKIDEREARAEERLRDYIERSDARVDDHEERLRTVEKCSITLDTKIQYGYLGTGVTGLAALAALVLKLIGGGL
jgi:4-hydroxyphenylpyruvate dioxygenase-like putative hemolysin